FFEMGGGVLWVWVAGYANDFYVNFVLVIFIPVPAKNAILMVVFARPRRMDEMAIVDAPRQGPSPPCRAVRMTAVWFIIGVLPMMVPTGGGAQSGGIIGTT
ncbi:efflux RND transporter permease subunit, partial [Enterobacter asburiae]